MVRQRSKVRGVGRVGVILAALLVSAGCGVLPFRSVEIPAGMTPRMSVDEVEAVVRSTVTGHVNALGGELRPFRVTRITLVPANQAYEAIDADGTPSGASFSEPFPFWAVEAEGTFRICGSTCSSYSLGLVIIDDATGEVRGDAAREPTRPSP
jgi:hypothetical protein